MNVAKTSANNEIQNTNIDWIGEIPSNWKCGAIREVLNFRNENNEPVKTKQILSLSIAHGVTLYSHEGRGGNKAKDDLTAYKIAHENDIVLNSMNVVVGAVGVSKFFGAISPVYYALFARSDATFMPFFEKVFQDKGFQSGLLRLGKGILMKKGVDGKLNTIRMKISKNDLKVVPIPIPPFNEQVSISNYIDDKTEKIDRAIGIKETQIARLEERKQILIQTAVTRGLDPNVPMKDSAVDWIGEIPVHWEEIRMCYIFRFSKGLTITKEDLRDEGIPCMNYGEIHSRFGFDVNPRLDELKCVDADYLETSANSLLRDGDFVFADTSEDLEGSGNFTYLNSDCLTFAGYHTVIARNLSDNKSRYLAYLFSAQAFRGQIRKSVNGVKVYTISQTKLRNPITIIPPVSEQIEIIQHLDKETQKITMAIDGIQSQISHLKEYRASLINAAVTGKVRVPN